MSWCTRSVADPSPQVSDLASQRCIGEFLSPFYPINYSLQWSETTKDLAPQPIVFGFYLTLCQVGSCTIRRSVPPLSLSLLRLRSFPKCNGDSDVLLCLVCLFWGRIQCFSDLGFIGLMRTYTYFIRYT